MSITGHERVRHDLATAVRRGELPGSILVHGLPGVGRQALALWLGRLLVCESPGTNGPCDACRSCRLALALQHPDIHWFFPLPRPKGASSPEKLADALEEARLETLQQRRADPLSTLTTGDDVVGYYLAQVRTIRRLGATRPAMAPRQVFIIGDAELLVPQEASEEAANALLKILEEPPPSTWFILTAAEPDALLPTLRSRLLPVRLRPFRHEEVRDFLIERAGADPRAADIAARLGQGSIGRALAFLPREGTDGRALELRGAARTWLAAALADDATARYAAAHAERPGGARGAFGDTLDLLALWLRDLACVAADTEDHVVNADALPFLRSVARELRPDAIPHAVRAVEDARDEGGINANPQLTLAHLLPRLHTLLRG